MNGRPYEGEGSDVFQTMSEFQRERTRRTVTKIPCKEGHFGSCMMLVGQRLSLSASAEPIRQVLYKMLVNRLGALQIQSCS